MKVKQEIIQRYADIVEELGIENDILITINDTLEEYIRDLSDKPNRLYDALLSCGENFNAQLIAEYNNSQGIPTRYISPKEAGLTVTDLPQQAQILDSAYNDIYKLRDYEEKLIIPGFRSLKTKLCRYVSTRWFGHNWRYHSTWRSSLTL